MIFSHRAVAVMAGTFAAVSVFAQGAMPNDPSTAPSDPGAASTPHQRATTQSPVTESPAAAGGTSPSDASTPHQKQATKKKHKTKKSSPDAPAPSP